jgi:tetratricopeptide (TPR) repeat protein/transcriptional regulator with XRE-family HTH domain
LPNHLLRQARDRKGWSQRQLAEYLDTNTFTVGRWELGLAFPSPHFRQKLSELFACTVEELGLIPERKKKSGGNGDEADHSTIATTTAHPAFAPVHLPSVGRLVGRDLLLSDLKQHLCAGDTVPVVALHGLPGVGKTTMTAALVADPEVQERFPDGVLWAGLGPTPQVFALLSSWASTLGVSGQDLGQINDVTTLSRVVGSMIQRRRFLLVIDDAWNIDDALAFKVGGSPCGHLITTRFPLLAEQFAPRHSVLIPEIGEDESMELFRQLAPLAVEQEPEQARILAQVTGGLPLAVTLIGNYLQTQAAGGQPRRIRTALEHLRTRDGRIRLAFPRSPTEYPPALSPEKPLSLQTIIATSVEHVSDEAQALLRDLALLPAKPNSFSEMAACAISGLSEEHFFIALDTLLDAGIIESVAPERYSLHQTIADYARLDEPSSEARRRLVHYFVAVMEQSSREYGNLDRELTNLLTALDIAYEQNFQEDLVLGCLALAPFLSDRSLVDILEVHITHALACVSDHSIGNDKAQLLFYRATIAVHRGKFDQGEEDAKCGLAVVKQSQQTDLICRFLALLTNISTELGQYEQALTSVEDGITLARQSHHYYQLCQLRNAHGMLLYRRGMVKQAQVAFIKGLNLARFIQAKECEAECLSGLGHVVRWQGDEHAGEELYQESLQIYQRLGYRERSIAVMLNLSVSVQNQGDTTRAEAYCLEGLATARAIGHQARMASALMNLGMQANMRGDIRQAEAYHRECLTICRDMHHHRLISYASTNLGAALLYQGAFLEAEERLCEGLRIACEFREFGVQCFALESLCHLALDQQQYGQAEHYAQECMVSAEQGGIKERIGTAYYITGKVKVEQGRFLEAAEAFEQALAIAGEVDITWLACDVRNGYGKCYLKQHRLEEAMTAFHQAEEISRTINSQIRLAIASFGIAQVAGLREEWDVARKRGLEILEIVEQSGQYLRHEIRQWLATLPTG